MLVLRGALRSLSGDESIHQTDNSCASNSASDPVMPHKGNNGTGRDPEQADEQAEYLASPALRGLTRDNGPFHVPTVVRLLLSHQHDAVGPVRDVLIVECNVFRRGKRPAMTLHHHLCSDDVKQLLPLLLGQSGENFRRLDLETLENFAARVPNGLVICGR